jgi:hypothetical protein
VYGGRLAYVKAGGAGTACLAGAARAADAVKRTTARTNRSLPPIQRTVLEDQLGVMDEPPAIITTRPFMAGSFTVRKLSFVWRA